MNTADVPTAWECPSRTYQRIPYGEMIWSAAIAWLVGFFLMANVAIAGVGCTGDVTRMPYPDAGGTTDVPIQLGSDPTENDSDPPLCSKREKLFFDGGVLSAPLPCDPFYDEKRLRGDPQP